MEGSGIGDCSGSREQTRSDALARFRPSRPAYRSTPRNTGQQPNAGTFKCQGIVGADILAYRHIFRGRQVGYHDSSGDAALKKLAHARHQAAYRFLHGGRETRLPSRLEHGTRQCDQLQVALRKAGCPFHRGTEVSIPRHIRN